MPFTTYKTDVDASAETLWQLMIDKIRNPHKYVPGVTSSKIVREFSDLSVEREMIAGTGADAKTVREIITADPATQTVIFKLKEDPDYTGYVLNAVFDEGGKVQLEYTMHWTVKDPAAKLAEPDWKDIIEKAVLHTKSLAESAA